MNLFLKSKIWSLIPNKVWLVLQVLSLNHHWSNVLEGCCACMTARPTWRASRQCGLQHIGAFSTGCLLMWAPFRVVVGFAYCNHSGRINLLWWLILDESLILNRIGRVAHWGIFLIWGMGIFISRSEGFPYFYSSFYGWQRNQISKNLSEEVTT